MDSDRTKRFAPRAAIIVRSRKPSNMRKFMGATYYLWGVGPKAVVDIKGVTETLRSLGYLVRVTPYKPCPYLNPPCIATWIRKR